MLLDALGTLVELEPPAGRLRHELRRRFGLSVSRVDTHRAIEAEMVYYRAHLNEGRDDSSLAGLRRRCAEVLWKALADVTDGLDPGPDALVDVLMGSLRFRTFDDVPGSLAALKELGLVLVVVSNWDVSLPAVLDRVGVAGLLDGVVTSAQTGTRKPDRAIFDRALELAGVSAEEAIHVGDSPREDLDGARGAGIEAVLLVRSGTAGPADVPRIRSLSELPALLGRANTGV